MNASKFIKVAVALILSGCASTKTDLSSYKSDANALLAEACSPGKSIKTASGRIWMKAESREAKGQFPALVKAQSPDRLDMEVTNLIGGTEAIIKVRRDDYEVKIPGKKSRAGRTSWGGIPLKWAYELFIGRVPCPELPLSSSAVASVNDDQGLNVRVKLANGAYEIYEYRFRDYDGKPWVKDLQWRRHGAISNQVHFTFGEPESNSRSPTIWEAKSNQGQVKVRWKRRNTEKI